MVENYSSLDAREDRLTIFVDREKEVALGSKADPRDVLSVGKREGVRLVTER